MCNDGIDNNCDGKADAADPTCQQPAPTPTPDDGGGRGGGGCVYQTCCTGAQECCTFDDVTCTCNCSPVLVDVSGDGFSLTAAPEGVKFDVNADGRSGRVAWTAAHSDDAWLALDRNGNGAIA